MFVVVLVHDLFEAFWVESIYGTIAISLSATSRSSAILKASGKKKTEFEFEDDYDQAREGSGGPLLFLLADDPQIARDDLNNPVQGGSEYGLV